MPNSVIPPPGLLPFTLQFLFQYLFFLLVLWRFKWEKGVGEQGKGVCCGEITDIKEVYKSIWNPIIL